MDQLPTFPWPPGVKVPRWARGRRGRRGRRGPVELPSVYGRLQAPTVGLEALPAVNTLRSQRTRRELRELRWTLDLHRSTSRAADDFADAYDHP